MMPGMRPKRGLLYIPMVTDVPSVSNFDAALTQLSLYDAYRLARDIDTTTVTKQKS